MWHATLYGARGAIQSIVRRYQSGRLELRNHILRDADRLRTFQWHEQNRSKKQTGERKLLVAQRCTIKS